MAEMQTDESALEALLRGGHKIPNSCRAGLCQSCLLKSDESFLKQDYDVRVNAQQGLSEQQIQSHHFLSCCCYPQGELFAESPDRNMDWQVEVVGRELLSSTVLELRLKTDGRWLPGQHVLLWKDDHAARPYSIVSHPDHDEIMTLHVHLCPGGIVSNWCHSDVRVGDQLRISPPVGHCVYDAISPDQTFLLVATGSGIVPLYGVIKEALAQAHQGRIHLVWCLATGEEVYLMDELRRLEGQNINFEFNIVERLPGEVTTSTFQPLVEQVKKLKLNLRDSQVYLSGNSLAFDAVAKVSFLAGARRSDIVQEAFE